ncbi:MAG: GH3 auxin-responsive promoter family protein [Candidatus Choladocola sp.]|nr:GH3 auxin-responsive promoter family protein [Candidatus Choladocola sp.]
MRFQEKLRRYSKAEIWDEYCGFLNMSMEEYMSMQNRLVMEEIEIWCGSELGRSILHGTTPHTIDEFRSRVPLTTYDDYAEILLKKESSCLPQEPVLWLQTTWEGGMHPMKVAPYTKSMLDTYKRNVMACFILATGNRRGDFDISVTDHMLYALAPLPFATGLLPVLIQDEIDIEYLPPVKEAVNMSFSERNKKGFKLGLKKGIEYFFGLGSVTYFVSKSLAALQSSGEEKSLLEKAGRISPKILVRYIKAKRKCRQENRELLPRDLFQLKGFMCAGTDNWCYKDDLEAMWGIRPMEIFAGTEPTCVGTETWSRNGMYFFPDACFYEFIPEDEMLKNMEDPSYTPCTVLMDEVVPGEKYEIVVTVLKGGAFVRYRVGDMYRCLGLGCKEDETGIPRFAYVDRVPSVIDIAGFTRITENSIRHSIELSGLQVKDWFAVKEYTKENRPQLHLYLEMDRSSLTSAAVSREILKDHLSVYFKYVDSDYTDLQKILGIDPLNISIVKCGTFEQYEKTYGRKIRRMNPPSRQIREFMDVQSGKSVLLKGGYYNG